MDIMGVNLDAMLAGLSPMFGIVGAGAAVLLLIGIVFYIITMARKENWLIFPWEYKWNFLIWRPSGDTWVYTFDKGAQINDGNLKKIKLQRGHFNVALPQRKFVKPGMQIEGFSASFGHFAPIDRTFIGYKGAPDPELIKEIMDLNAKLDVDGELQLSKEQREIILSQLHNKEREVTENITNLQTAYEPYFDLNTQNMAAQEAEKVNMQFPRQDDIKQLIMIGAIILVLLINILIAAQNTGTQIKMQEAMTAASLASSAAQQRSNDIMNETLTYLGRYSVKPTSITYNTTGG